MGRAARPGEDRAGAAPRSPQRLRRDHDVSPGAGRIRGDGAGDRRRWRGARDAQSDCERRRRPRGVVLGARGAGGGKRAPGTRRARRCARRSRRVGGARAAASGRRHRGGSCGSPRCATAPAPGSARGRASHEHAVRVLQTRTRAEPVLRLRPGRRRQGRRGAGRDVARLSRGSRERRPVTGDDVCLSALSSGGIAGVAFA